MAGAGDNPQHKDPLDDKSPAEKKADSLRGTEFTGAGDKTMPDAPPPTYELGDVVEPPAVPGGDEHPGKGDTTVNTEAMRRFAKNMRTLHDALSKTPDHLNKVALKPGVFATAHEKIEKPITGPDGLRQKVSDELANLLGFMGDTAEQVDKAANGYDSADRLNKMTADDYTKYFGQVTTDLGGSAEKPKS